ncbi:hypothetical protein FKM82_000066 [Ascaphus truei]
MVESSIIQIWIIAHLPIKNKSIEPSLLFLFMSEKVDSDAAQRNEADCLENVNEFLKAWATLRIELLDANDLYTGENFSKVLSTLNAVNKATEDQTTERPCSRTMSQSLNFAACSPINPPGADCSSRVLKRHFKAVDMTGNGSYQLIVKARFDFKQQNEDELSFCKGDTINYVKEFKSNDKPLSPKALKGYEAMQLTTNYYTVVLQNILETERDYTKELQLLLSTYLRPLQTYDKISTVDIISLLGNFEELCIFQQTLCQALEDGAKLAENQQKVGGCFLHIFNHFKSLYLSYCANHPMAVGVLTQHSDELERFMETQGAAGPGILMLTMSLSKPFTRLDKYVILLQGLERHMEEAHPDHQDILKATASFKALVAQCQELRKRKQLELQILSDPIQGWEGEDIKMMGSVVYMSQVMVQCGAGEDKDERYFMLFSNVLLMLSASPRMSGFIYQGKLPLTGMSIVKIEENEINNHAFEITGIMIEPSLGYKVEPKKSPKTLKKFLQKRKNERKHSDNDSGFRKSTVALEEDAQTLKVIEAYNSAPQLLLLEEDNLIIEETRSNGQAVTKEKCLIDTVYALRDEEKVLKQENKRMKQSLDEEQKSRK